MVLVRIFTIFLLFLFGSSILVFGQTPQRIYVNVSAVDTINANGSLNLPYHRIQLAINNAVKGDSIFVSKGRYLENINFLGKEIFVSSNYFFSKDTTDISQTIIDGNNKDIAVKFQSNETRKSVLYGFNVTNGWAGISIANCSPTLDYLILEGNRSVYDRGSAIIASDNCSFLLDHSTIRNHTGGNGIISIGNIHSDSAYTIRNSIFHNNICQNTVVISDGRGGGIFENNLFYNHTVPAIGFINTQNGIKIINTTIVSNGAESVRHLYNNIYQSNVIIVNSILNSENTSLQIGMNNPIPSTFFVIKNSFVKGGAQAISRLQTTTLEDSSTIFSDVSQIQNFVQNNFRLQNSSSLIGSGISSFIFNSQEIKSPISDILGNSRPNPTGSSPDLGAYESPFKHPSPLVISAEGGDKSVRLRWTQAPGSRLARYKVFRSTSPIPDNTTAGVVTDTISVGRLEYMDATGLTNLTRYHYRMKTIDSAGIESGMSNEISVTPNVLPATPSGISVEKGPGRIGIKWQISSDLSTTYEVLRRSKDSSIQILFSNKRVSSFIDSNINVGEYYEYAVRSIDQFGVKSIINFSNYINSNQLIFVSKTGNDEALGSLESPLLTISKALSISKNNDTVIVNTGIYLERIIINKKIVLGSQYILTSDSSFRSKTIIDGQSGGTVIRTDVAGVKIMGITIQNGYSSQGGGVFGSNLELDYIIIRKCRGVGDIDGGGAYIGGRTKITNSLFEENIGRKGGALTLFPSNDTIFVNNSVFKYNNGWENGSGIICFGNLSSIVLVKNCVFDKNVGGSSVIHVQGPKALVYNSNLLNNSVSSIFMFNGNIEVNNSILRNTVTDEVQSLIGPNPGSVLINYSNIKGGYTGIGNIDYDPEFVDSNLIVIKNSSPNIGNGVNSPFVFDDYFGSPRPSPTGSFSDIGVYESPFKHPAPVVVAIEGANESVRLGWTQAQGPGIAKIKLYRSTSPIPDNSTTGVVTDTISVNRLEYLDTSGLMNLTKYYYRLKTVDSSGVESGMSNEVSVIPNIPPAVPDSFDVELGPRSSFLQWKKSSDTTLYYTVYRTTDRSTFTKLADSVKENNYLDSNLISGKEYGYRIQAVDRYGVAGAMTIVKFVTVNSQWWISSSGSNLNLGSKKYPKKEINTFVNQLQSNDTIYIFPGLYHETLNISTKVNIIGWGGIDSLTNPSNIILFDFKKESIGFHLNKAFIKNICLSNAYTGINARDSIIIDSCLFTGLLTGVSQNQGPGDFLIQNSIFRHNENGLGTFFKSPTIKKSIFNNNFSAISVYNSNYFIEGTLFYYNNFGLNIRIDLNGGGKIGNVNYSTFANNTNSIYNGDGLLYLNNSILWGGNQKIVLNGTQSSLFVDNIILENGISAIDTLNFLNRIKEFKNVQSKDPRYENSTFNNFRILPSSPAIGIGRLDQNSTLGNDLAGMMRPNPIGSSPDIGAYESPLSIPAPLLDDIQRVGDSVFIPWSYHDRSLVDSIIILRSFDENLDINNFQTKTIKLNPNQLVIRDTLFSSSVCYYAIKVRMTNGIYTTSSNIKASNALMRKTSFLPPMVNARYLWGDIDADGDLDLAVMGETPGIFFQLYRNNNGAFVELFNRSQVPQLFKGTMKFADTDNDGDIDLIASGQKTTAINNLGTFLFKNDGTGNFTSSEMIDIVSTREGDMAFGDHDNDGDLDMALSGIDVNGLSRLTVYNNNGKGTFSIERRLFPSQGGPSDPLYSDLQWVDYDNDGDQDLIFSGRASGASAGIVTNTLFNGNQTNNFSGSNIRYYSEWALRNAAVETADLNSDGWVDIIVSGSLENGNNLNRQTRIIYGSKNGFQTATIMTLDNIAGQVKVADFDNDGDLDILLSGLDQQANPKTIFYSNIGPNQISIQNSIFSSWVGFTPKSYEIIPNLDRSAFSWADYDNDGDLDLVISGQKPASQGGQVLSEIYTFEPEKKNLSPNKPEKPTIQNFGDGRIIVSWVTGKDDLTPAKSLNYLLKIGTVSLTGIPAQSYTVVESNKNGGTLLNPETGLIYGTNYFTQLNPGRYYFLLQVVDHNKLTSQPSDTLFLTLAYPWKFVNQGGIVDAAISPNSRYTAKWGDFDRDNDYDFVYGMDLYESNRINYSVSTYQFDDRFLFDAPLPHALLKPNIKWHDISQDGIPDMIVSSTESINPSNATYAKFRLNIFKNDPRLSETGRGRLSRLSLGAEDSIYLGNTRFKVTDLNNDGKPDILLAGIDKTAQSKVHVFTTGPLSTDKTSPPGFKFSRLNTNLDSILLAQSSYDLEFDFGDVDGDSDNDFVAFFKNELGDLIAKTYLNTGINLATGKITFVQSSTYTFESLDRPSIDLLDYDKDGDLDLLTSGRSFASGQQFNIYESRNGAFVKIANPIQSIENAKLSFGDINNDGYSDLIYTGTREGSGLISKIAVFNPTTKGFEEQSQFLFGEEFSDLNIEFGDFDADSDLDILVNGVLSGATPRDLFRVYKNVQNESARLLKALGTTINSLPTIKNQENIKTESSLERSFSTVLNDATVSDVYVENNAPTTPLNLTEKIISRVGDVYRVRFSWDASTDDHTPVEGLSYELRVGTSPGISDEVVSLSLPDGFRMIPEEGNTGRKRVWDIDLKPGTYYWSAQSVDASFAGSPFAEERRFAVDANGQICDGVVPILTYSKSLAFCEGDSILLASDKKQGIQWFRNDVLIETAQDSLLKVFTSGEYKARYVNAACSSSFSNPVFINVNAKPAAGKIDASATEVCLGTPVSLTASLDSVYQWFRNDSIMTGVFNQKITVNQSGTYTFISKFNGCTSPKSSPISIVVSPVPTASFTMSSSSICEGTKVTLTASNGTGYTYQWLKNGINIAGATSSTYSTGDPGKYSLVVSLNKCSAVSNIDSLSVTPIPVAGTINASATTVCEGTSITLNASSDSVYQWFRNDNLLTSITGKTITTKESGTYSFNIRINGCVSPKSAVLNATVNPVPIATYTMSSSAICEGSKVTLTASTGTGYNYQWLKNGVNISGATSSTYAAGETGRYAVLVSSNGCNATSTSDSLTVTTIPSKPTISKDGTELVSSSAAGNLWYAEGNLISGANQQRYKPTNNGNYSARVRTNGCESVMSETYYFLVTALVELGNDQYIKAYPNPLTNGQDLVIDWRLGGINTTMKAEVFDPNGKKVADKVLTKNNNRLKINGGSGLYFIQLSWGDSKRQTIRVIKN